MKKLLLLLVIIFLPNCSNYVIKGKPSKTLLISHKGIWKDGKYPANSIKAFDEALRQGFDGFELDAVLTADNQLLVIHDNDLEYTTNCKGLVNKSKLSDLNNCLKKQNTILPVSAILIQKTKHKDRLSSLRQIFTKYLPQQKVKHIVVDIKAKDKRKTIIALKKALPQKIRKRYSHKLIFIAKSTSTLRDIKNIFPKSFTALEGKWGSEPVVEFDKYLNLKTHDYVSLNAQLMFGHTKLKKHLFGSTRRNRKYLNNYFIAAKDAKIPTIAWTITSKKSYKYLLSKEVDFILTDLSLDH
jgi:glycerophosphoryl diester phosphodiesterase